MRNKVRCLSAVVLLFGLAAGELFAGEGETKEKGELLVFTRDSGSAVAKEFEAVQLPELKQIAEELGIGLREIDVAKGVPSQVNITPSLVFADHRGRSVYQGRLTTLDRVRNFIQTSTFVHQEDARLERDQVVTRDFGRTTVASPIKIATVDGHQPRGYNETEFQKEARAAIAKGLVNSKVADVALGRTDRSFYMDFYPWRSRFGTLHLSYALFSQFHCKEAVFFSGEEEKLKGAWSKRDELFAEAARRLEVEVEKQLALTKTGDGFDPVPADTPVVDWPPLPEAPEVVAPVMSVDLGREWTVVEEGDLPPIVFRFPAPLEQYSGQVTGLRGELTFSDKGGGDSEGGEELSLADMSGFFIADPKTVRMGEPDLDDALQGKTFLSTKAFPESRFTISKAESDDSVAFGRLSAVVLHGTFELRGKKVPLKVVADVEPRVSKDGEPRLLFRGSWILDFNGMGIEPADGPAPANHTLHFDTHILLGPR